MVTNLQTRTYLHLAIEQKVGREESAAIGPSFTPQMEKCEFYSEIRPFLD